MNLIRSENYNVGRSIDLTGLIRNIGIIMLAMNNEIKLSPLPQQQKYVDDGTGTMIWLWFH